jgi:hypothetical protein
LVCAGVFLEGEEEGGEEEGERGGGKEKANEEKEKRRSLTWCPHCGGLRRWLSVEERKELASYSSSTSASSSVFVQEFYQHYERMTKHHHQEEDEEEHKHKDSIAAPSPACLLAPGAAAAAAPNTHTHTHTHTHTQTQTPPSWKTLFRQRMQAEASLLQVMSRAHKRARRCVRLTPSTAPFFAMPSYGGPLAEYKRRVCGVLGCVEVVWEGGGGGEGEGEGEEGGDDGGRGSTVTRKAHEAWHREEARRKREG